MSEASKQACLMHSLICRSAESGQLTRLVFSKPSVPELPEKKAARLALIRKSTVLAFENTSADRRISHENIPACDPDGVLLSDICRFDHVTLLTDMGNAELMRSKKGKETVLGAAALEKALKTAPTAANTVLPYNREAKHILSGNEPFLIMLGVSDESGRIHDKKQGKFRQINRFLELVRDLYDKLPAHGVITVYDLCSGKSYLSFALYHYLTVMRGRTVDMLCADLKADVMAECSDIAAETGFLGMRFLAADITALPRDKHPDMVVSLHACDIATDIVLDTAAALGASVILSTPCCHRYLKDRINTPELSFVYEHPHLRTKLGEVMTEGLRILKLRSEGYTVQAIELTDPVYTPKNTLIRAVKRKDLDASGAETDRARKEYEKALSFLMGEGGSLYLKDVIS